MNKKYNFISFLAPISFILSLVSFILVTLDAKDFTIKNISEKKKYIVTNEIRDSKLVKPEISPMQDPKINDNADRIEFEDKTLSLNESISVRQNIQTKDSILNKNTPLNKDIPQVNTKKQNPDMDQIIKDLNTASVQPKIIEPTKIVVKPASGIKIKFKTLNNKDDANLELNKIRLKYKDVLKKVDTYIHSIKTQNGETYVIFGNIKDGTPNEAKAICSKVSPNGTHCSIV